MVILLVRTQQIAWLAAVTVAVGLAMAALVPRNWAQKVPERWSFSIEPEPATATVALLNGPEPYRPGMLLALGEYEVKVRAPGFATRPEWVTHAESETVYRVVLESLLCEAYIQPRSDPTAPAKVPTALDTDRVAINVSDASEPIAEGSAVSLH